MSKTVLSKAVLILDVLAELGVAGVSELSRTTGLAKTTAARTATEMVSVGLLERSGDGYRLGTKLFDYGSRVPGRRHLREAALPFLEDLSHATNQTVHLAVLDEGEVIYVERLVGKRSNEVPSAVAARLPLHCTATGKCILAFGPDSLTDAIIASPLEPLTARSISNPAKMRMELVRVKKSGVAVERGEVVEGLVSIAAPLRAHRGALVGAISATGPEDDFDEAQIEQLIRLAASGLSRRLGFDSDEAET